jgi:hypothetical protein
MTLPSCSLIVMSCRSKGARKSLQINIYAAILLQQCRRFRRNIEPRIQLGFFRSWRVPATRRPKCPARHPGFASHRSLGHTRSDTCRAVPDRASSDRRGLQLRYTTARSLVATPDGRGHIPRFPLRKRQLCPRACSAQPFAKDCSSSSSLRNRRRQKC